MEILSRLYYTRTKKAKILQKKAYFLRKSLLGVLSQGYFHRLLLIVSSAAGYLKSQFHLGAGRVILQLLLQGDTVRAQKALDYCEKQIPEYNVPHDFNSGSLDAARIYMELGQKDKGMDILKKLWTKSEQYVRWYCSLSGMRFAGAQQDCRLHLVILQQAAMYAADGDRQWSEKKMGELQQLFNMFQSKGGTFQGM